MNRRDFIASASSIVALNPFLSVLANYIQPVSPQSSGVNKYVIFYLYGAPSRRVFDHILIPYKGANFVKPDSTGNGISELGPYKNRYKTISHKGIEFPSLWGNSIMTNNGSPVSMLNLTDNMMVIRGVDMVIHGHPFCASKVIAPEFGGFATCGINSDHSSDIIDMICLGKNPSTRAFKAKKSNQINLLTEEGIFDILCKPLNNKDFDLFSKESLISYLDELEAQTSGDEQKIIKPLKKARESFIENLGEMRNSYNAIHQKYKKILDHSQQVELKENKDFKKVPLKFPFSVIGDKSVEEAIGIYSIFDDYYVGEDFNEVLRTAKIPFLVSSFTLAEFCLVHNLTSNLLLSPINEMGNFFEEIKDKKFIRGDDILRKFDKEKNITIFSVKPNAKLNSAYHQELSFDSHDTGTLLDIMSSNLYFYCFSACLNEFIEILKTTKDKTGKRLYDQTLVHLTSEFDRVQKVAGSGSNHNQHGHVSTFFSGVISGPQLLGNIYIDNAKRSGNEDLSFSGTIGVAAPVKKIHQSIKIQHLHSTISYILNIPSQTKRFPSLVKFENNKIVSNIARANNV